MGQVINNIVPLVTAEEEQEVLWMLSQIAEALGTTDTIQCPDMTIQLIQAGGKIA
jgi:hypothetical protein